MSYPPPSDCLPHEPPMVLLREIEWVEADSLCASVYLGYNDIFNLMSDLPIAWALEIIAQAAAAYIGIKHVSEGYTSGRLIRASSFKTNTDILPQKTKLAATVKKTAESEMGVFLFEGSLTEGNNLLVETKLTILVK